MNGNPLIGQLLGGVIGHAMRRRGMAAGRGIGIGGVAVAAILARMVGRARGNMALMLLPLALRWVQRNGGVAAMLKRFQHQGYGAQANSWVATGANRDLDEHAIHELVGQQELEKLSLETGVPQHELAHGFAEILPEVVDQLTPAGKLTPEADELLEDGRTELEQEIVQATRRQAGP